jgi:hypothetical protein
MKKLELNTFGVEEMSIAEMTKTQGGGLLSGLLSAITTTVGSVVGDTLQYAFKQVNTILNLVKSL